MYGTIKLQLNKQITLRKSSNVKQHQINSLKARIGNLKGIFKSFVGSKHQILCAMSMPVGAI